MNSLSKVAALSLLVAATSFPGEDWIGRYVSLIDKNRKLSEEVNGRERELEAAKPAAPAVRTPPATRDTSKRSSTSRLKGQSRIRAKQVQEPRDPEIVRARMAMKQNNADRLKLLKGSVNEENLERILTAIDSGLRSSGFARDSRDLILAREFSFFAVRLFPQRDYRAGFAAKLDGSVMPEAYARTFVNAYVKSVLNQGDQAELASALELWKKLIANRATPKEIRFAILRRIGQHPNLESPNIFLENLEEADPLGRAAVFRGLYDFIRARSGKGFDAVPILDAVAKSQNGPSLDEGAVAVLASLRSPVANQFLLGKCAHQPELLVLAASHQPGYNDRALLTALLRSLEKNGNHEGKVRSVIETSFQESQERIAEWLAGNEEDASLALRLLIASPDEASKHKDAILDLAGTGTLTSGSSRLAFKLLPVLPGGDEIIRSKLNAAASDSERSLISQTIYGSI